MGILIGSLLDVASDISEQRPLGLEFSERNGDEEEQTRATGGVAENLSESSPGHLQYQGRLERLVALCPVALHDISLDRGSSHLWRL